MEQPNEQTRLVLIKPSANEPTENNQPLFFFVLNIFSAISSGYGIGLIDTNMLHELFNAKNINLVLPVKASLPFVSGLGLMALHYKENKKLLKTFKENKPYIYNTAIAIKHNIIKHPVETTFAVIAAIAEFFIIFSSSRNLFVKNIDSESHYKTLANVLYSVGIFSAISGGLEYFFIDGLNLYQRTKHCGFYKRKELEQIKQWSPKAILFYILLPIMPAIAFSILTFTECVELFEDYIEKNTQNYSELKFLFAFPIALIYGVNHFALYGYRQKKFWMNLLSKHFTKAFGISWTEIKNWFYGEHFKCDFSVIKKQWLQSPLTLGTLALISWGFSGIITPLGSFISFRQWLIETAPSLSYLMSVSLFSLVISFDNFATEGREFLRFIKEQPKENHKLEKRATQKMEGKLYTLKDLFIDFLLGIFIITPRVIIEEGILSDNDENRKNPLELFYVNMITASFLSFALIYRLKTNKKQLKIMLFALATFLSTALLSSGSEVLAYSLISDYERDINRLYKKLDFMGDLTPFLLFFIFKKICHWLFDEKVNGPSEFDLENPSYNTENDDGNSFNEKPAFIEEDSSDADMQQKNNRTLKIGEHYISCEDIYYIINEKDEIKKERSYTAGFIDFLLYAHNNENIKIYPATILNQLHDQYEQIKMQEENYSFIPLNVPYGAHPSSLPNHWVALIIDKERQLMFYLDPACQTDIKNIDPEIAEKLDCKNGIILNPINFQASEQQEKWIRHCGAYTVEMFTTFAKKIKSGNPITGAKIANFNLGKNSTSLKQAFKKIQYGTEKKVNKIRNDHIKKALDLLSEMEEINGEAISNSEKNKARPWPTYYTNNNPHTTFSSKKTKDIHSKNQLRADLLSTAHPLRKSWG